MHPSTKQLLTIKRLFVVLVVFSATQVLLCLWLAPLWQSPEPKSFKAPAPSKRQLRYITVEFTNRRRLGNLLFDYAALQGIAHSHNMTAVIPSYFPALDVFDLKVKVVDNVFQHLGMWHRFYERYASKFDNRVNSHLPSPPNHVILNGFYQSWKYFADFEKELRTHFRFRPHIQAAAEQFMKEKGLTDDLGHLTRVGIHVRRGDIVTASDIIRKGYNTPSQQYYLKAMEHFKSRHESVKFIIVTDTPDWVKTHISGDNVLLAKGNPAGVDLAILSLCDHVIMSVGTFGWWGAWLAGGNTVYYDRWPLRGSYLAGQVKAEDYFPPHWTPMH